MSTLARQVEHVAAALAARAKRRAVLIRNDAVRWYYTRRAETDGGEIAGYMRRMRNRSRSALLTDLALLTGESADWIELHALIEYGVHRRLMSHHEAAQQIGAARAIIGEKGEI